jgi:hypothetical protein
MSTRQNPSAVHEICQTCREYLRDCTCCDECQARYGDCSCGSVDALDEESED